MFRGLGTFSLSSLDAELRVSEDDRILSYAVVTSDGRELFHSTDGPSTLHNWVFYWDHEKKVLWFSSSDIGVFVWEPQDDETYRQTKIFDDSEYIRKMPDEFFRVLPTSTQRAWGVERGRGGDDA